MSVERLPDRSALRVFAALVALSGLACSRPERRFPIGLFGVNKPSDLAEIKDAGFDSIQSYLEDPAQLSALGQEARRVGLETLFFPGPLSRAGLSARSFPAAAWYLSDEPEVHRVEPAAIAAAARETRTWDPAGRTALVVGTGGAASRYRDSADVIMVDWYPVPHLPLASAGAHVRTAVEGVAPKPVWAVLQAMDWRWYAQRDPSRPRVGRFPDSAEMRFMAYHAAAAGAEGIWFFAFTAPDGKTLPESPEYWQAVRRVSRELAYLRPVFGRGAPRSAASLPIGPALIAKAWRRGGRDYLVILNPSAEPQEFPKPLLDIYWRPLFEPRRYTPELLTRRGGHLLMLPKQVLVFESRLSAGSRLGPPLPADLYGR